jgi:hypothetical protein
VHFRKEFTVRELDIVGLSSDGLELFLGGPHSLRVRLRNPTTEEIAQGNRSNTLFCSAQQTWEPNPGVTQVLRDLSERRVPKGHHIPAGPAGERFLDGPETLKEPRLPLSFLPDSAQSLLNQVHDELAEAIRRTIKLLRWRWGVPGSHNPFAARIQQEGYSFDGVHWYRLPTTLSMEISSPRYFELTSKRVEVLGELVSTAGKDEPLGHELLREAGTLSSQAPRSALLIGVSALEVGFKELVADLVPHAAWLVENAPTPPVVRMLLEYLPTLPARLNFQGKVLPPPGPIVDQLKKANQARNRVTHAGGASLHGESLVNALQAVQDVLWLFDYYAGHLWALGHMRKETRVALTGQPEPDEEDNL